MPFSLLAPISCPSIMVPTHLFLHDVHETFLHFSVPRNISVDRTKVVTRHLRNAEGEKHFHGAHNFGVHTHIASNHANICSLPYCFTQSTAQWQIIMLTRGLSPRLWVVHQHNKHQIAMSTENCYYLSMYSFRLSHSRLYLRGYLSASLLLSP